MSDDQDRALDGISEFLERPGVPKPFVVLQGLAGTGKTFVLARLAERFPDMKLAAYTGKAASVLRKRINRQVATMHSAIYDFHGLVEDDDDSRRMNPIFVPKGEGHLARHTIGLDEVSMIGQRDGAALLSSGARIVACGDPGQLSPVRDTQFFTRADYTLTKVHRQAWDSPIIRQAHAVRETGDYEADGDGFRVLEPDPGEKINREELLRHDAILCWKNVTRRRLNRTKREMLGLPADRMTPGEPVMCLQNQHRLGLYNGVIYEIVETDGEGMVVREEGSKRGVLVEQATLEGFDRLFDARRYDEDWLPFAPGYAMTVHKAQGSEYESVLLFDECRESDRRAFLYTGITRAAERCTVVRW